MKAHSLNLQLGVIQEGYNKVRESVTLNLAGTVLLNLGKCSINTRSIKDILTGEGYGEKNAK